MEYRKKLLDLIHNGNQEQFNHWIKSQAPFDQVEIMRQLKEISIENMLETDDYSIANSLSEFDEKIDKYQDAILDGMNAKKEYDKVLNDIKNTRKVIYDKYNNMHPIIINSIVSNDENTIYTKKNSEIMIEFEKENGTFDPEKWKAIL